MFRKPAWNLDISSSSRLSEEQIKEIESSVTVPLKDWEALQSYFNSGHQPLLNDPFIEDFFKDKVPPVIPIMFDVIQASRAIYKNDPITRNILFQHTWNQFIESPTFTHQGIDLKVRHDGNTDVTPSMQYGTYTPIFDFTAINNEDPRFSGFSKKIITIHELAHSSNIGPKQSMLVSPFTTFSAERDIIKHTMEAGFMLYTGEPDLDKPTQMVWNRFIEETYAASQVIQYFRINKGQIPNTLLKQHKRSSLRHIPFEVLLASAQKRSPIIFLPAYIAYLLLENSDVIQIMESTRKIIQGKTAVEHIFSQDERTTEHLLSRINTIEAETRS